ncbi:hypothetical protein VTH06DRAFT_1846, partial [Thermothelomyces fergusii]
GALAAGAAVPGLAAAEPERSGGKSPQARLRGGLLARTSSWSSSSAGDSEAVAVVVLTDGASGRAGPIDAGVRRKGVAGDVII